MLVATERLTRVYPGPPRVDAVRAVDLEIPAGAYLAIMGSSGSGKSTLLNLLGLLDRPTSGRLSLSGRDVTGLGDAARTSLRAGRIGFVFQQFHLLGDRTATENVALALLYAGAPRSDRLRRAEEALAVVGLAHRSGATPAQLSGGEQQRVAIARAIVHQPALLLADEPTGNLDTATGAGVLDTFDRLHDGGQTVVVVTHDLAVARRASQVRRMSDGRLVTGPAP